jgi:predicted phage baseplate assembly protein
MTIPSPNLDDREFLDLVAEAVEQIQATAPEWTDLGPGDPGMTLIEVFAHLTEVMIFRLNRVPDKAYRAYLNLIGTQLRPPAAARTTLRFSRSDPERDGEAIEIPRATRVTLADAGAGDRPIFVVPEATASPCIASWSTASWSG